MEDLNSPMCGWALQGTDEERVRLHKRGDSTPKYLVELEDLATDDVKIIHAFAQ